MTVAVLILALVIVVVGAAVLVWQRWRERRVKPDRRVRLHIARDDGSEVTIEGFLVERVAGHYCLRRVQMIVGAGDEVALQGDVEVPEGRVLFVQVLQA